MFSSSFVIYLSAGWPFFPSALNSHHIAIHNRCALCSLECNAQAQRQPDPALHQATSGSMYKQQIAPDAHIAQLQELHQCYAELEHQKEEHHQRQEEKHRLQAEQHRKAARFHHEE